MNSIEKALEILLAFTPYNQEMGTVEISRKLGFHKATVSRDVSILNEYGFLKRDPQTKLFKLGQSAIKLGLAVNQSISNNLISIAKPFIDDLRTRLGETIVLEVLSGDRTIMGYIAEGPGPIRIKGNVGDHRPVHAAAGAKAILAFAPPEVQDKLLVDNLERYTPNTVTDKKVYKKQLIEIKKCGFAFDNNEVNIGINAVGVPVFNYEKTPVAAVVVAGLAHGITWEESSPIVSSLKDTAAKISARLYYEEGP